MADKVCDTETAKSSEQKDKSVPPRKAKCTIKLIPERCKGCTYCIEFCPKKVLKVSPEINSKGYHIPVVGSPENCICCKLCELICPDFCIFVEKNTEEEKK